MPQYKTPVDVFRSEAGVEFDFLRSLQDESLKYALPDGDSFGGLPGRAQRLLGVSVCFRNLSFQHSFLIAEPESRSSDWANENTGSLRNDEARLVALNERYFVPFCVYTNKTKRQG